MSTGTRQSVHGYLGWSLDHYSHHQVQTPDLTPEWKKRREELGPMGPITAKGENFLITTLGRTTI